MKFVTFASLAVAVNAQDQILATSSTGALNYHWTEDMNCPNFASATSDEGLVEIIKEGTGTKTFEGWAQECAELAYGLSAEYAPCIQVMYLPGGASFAADGGADPWYGCRAYEGTVLEHKDKYGDEYDILVETGSVNINDDNNRVAACINTSPTNVAGAYSCSRGPILGAAGYLTLGAAAALSVASMI